MWLSGTTPRQDTSPKPGFRPTRPHAAAGILIEPPVSVPIDASDMPVATATADPPLDPPGDRSAIERMADRAECRLVAGRAERELVKVRLADEDGARLAQRGGDRRVRRGADRPARRTRPS